MTFEEILDQAIAMLQRRGRLTYGGLKRQFNLDDTYLEDVKNELIEGQRLAVDEEGRVLVWTGDPAVPKPDAQRGVEVESRVHALLPEVRAVLQRDRRVTYRRLTYIFRLDQRALAAVRRELLFQQVARDEQGEGLVWMGEASPALPPAVAVPHPPATAETMPGPFPALSTRPLPITAGIPSQRADRADDTRPRLDGHQRASRAGSGRDLPPAPGNSASRPGTPQNSSRCCLVCSCCIWDAPSLRRRGSSGSSAQPGSASR